MKRFLDIVKHTPMLLALILIAIFFFPSAITSPSESISSPVITALGIDRAGEEYEITVLTFLSYPNQSYSESYEVYTANGSSLSEALSKCALQVGKNISLFHAHTTVVSEKLLEEDIAPSLDYLVRVASLPQSCVLVATNVACRDFIKFIKDLNKQSDINLEELSFYNSNYVSWEDATINAFMQSYYSPTRAFMMSYFPIEESDIGGIPLESSSGGGSSGGSNGGGEANGGGSSGGSGGSSNGGGGGDQKKQELVNDGSELIVKDGKKVGFISRDILKGINWFNSDTTGAEIVLENLEDENFSGATLVYRVTNKDIKSFASFENGLPVLNCSLKLYVSLVEVDGDKDDLSKKHELSYLSSAVRDGIESQVKNDVRSALDLLKENKADILEFYELFYRMERTKTKQFLEKIGDAENFLENLTIKFIVSIYPN